MSSFNISDKSGVAMEAIRLQILMLGVAHDIFHLLVDAGEDQGVINESHDRLLREKEHLNALIHQQVCAVCPGEI